MYGESLIRHDRIGLERRLQFSIRTVMLATINLAVLMVLFREEAGSRNHFGVFSPHFSALMASIYFWKYMIIQSGASRFDRREAFGVLLFVAVPFVYWQC